MHITSVFATTIDGKITDINGKISFVTDESFHNYKNALRHTSCAIAGRTTYEVVQNAGDLEGLNVKTVVITTDPNYKPVNADDLVAHNPEEAISLLQNEG